MKKILVGYIEDGRHSGIDKYLLNFAEAAFEQGVKIDFLTNQIDDELQTRLERMGFGLIKIPSLKRPFKQYRAIRRILRGGSYAGAYFNISESFNCMGLWAAHAEGVPVRIVHSHNSGVDRANKQVRVFRTCLHKICKPLLSCFATDYLTCSEVAARWMYSKKIIQNQDFKIIYNAVDGAKFAYSEEVRRRVRKELGISSNTLVLGHVGHFNWQKNHRFLMQTVKIVCDRYPDCVLLAIGIGADLDPMKAYARDLGISDHVRFLGVRTDVQDLLCAMDIFVFPSRFEGLSVTCVEAQFSGLPCVFSSSISPETKISDRVVFLPTQNPEEWAKCIMDLRSERSIAHLNQQTVLCYDFKNQKQQLTDIIGKVLSK